MSCWKSALLKRGPASPAVDRQLVAVKLKKARLSYRRQDIGKAAEDPLVGGLGDSHDLGTDAHADV